jgi:hypothetical protein
MFGSIHQLTVIEIVNSLGHEALAFANLSCSSTSLLCNYFTVSLNHYSSG